MIGTLDVSIQAEKPNFPLPKLRAFVNSPSSIRVRNVPRSVGKWNVTKVYLTANYPSNASVSIETVLVGGVWVGTIAASAAVGTSINGYQITADGVDENGLAVTGYVLGIGDVEILARDGTITVGATTYYFHLLDVQPSTPKKGDVAKIDGVYKLYNGSAWESLGSGGGSGDVKHSDFTAVAALENATLKETSAKVNELLSILKGSSMIMLALVPSLLFATLGPNTEFGDVPPSSKLSEVVAAGGGSSGGVTSNDVSAIISSDLNKQGDTYYITVMSAATAQSAATASSATTATSAQSANMANSSIYATFATTNTGDLAWGQVRMTPTTVAGYGITDAVTGVWDQIMGFWHVSVSNAWYASYAGGATSATWASKLSTSDEEHTLEYRDERWGSKTTGQSITPFAYTSELGPTANTLVWTNGNSIKTYDGTKTISASDVGALSTSYPTSEQFANAVTNVVLATRPIPSQADWICSDGVQRTFYYNGNTGSSYQWSQSPDWSAGGPPPFGFSGYAMWSDDFNATELEASMIQGEGNNITVTRVMSQVNKNGIMTFVNTDYSTAEKMVSKFNDSYLTYTKSGNKRIVDFSNIYKSNDSIVNTPSVQEYLGVFNLDGSGSTYATASKDIRFSPSQIVISDQGLFTLPNYLIGGGWNTTIYSMQPIFSKQNELVPQFSSYNITAGQIGYYNGHIYYVTNNVSELSEIENNSVVTNVYSTLLGKSQELVAPVSNVVFNSETYLSIDNDSLELVQNTNIVWKSVYELTNYNNTTSLTLYSGQVAYLTLDADPAHTNVSLTLKFPKGSQSAGDALVRINAATNSVVGLVSMDGYANFTIEGQEKWWDVAPGKSMLSFTKTAVSNGVAEVWAMNVKSEK